MRATSGRGSQVDQVICYGTLIGFVILTMIGILRNGQERKEAAAEKQEWKKGCVSVEAAIVTRYHYPGGTYEDEYGIPHTSRPKSYLDLELNADLKTAAPNDTVVRVDVYSTVYDQLEKRNTVRIYYKPEAPLTFLLAEEF